MFTYCYYTTTYCCINIYHVRICMYTLCTCNLVLFTVTGATGAMTFILLTSNLCR
ncbi:hypothetical protein GBAR_LOCUS12100 [Geodia barretti]|uniref:Uncharacterized protein n=1 Tax=Geodia barretti TaxID=519541 RepID=A0AA35WG64_GEOBA|nr:hypothetical protein GBAR_LOCUS12100 [Geodia barretti]